MIEKNILKAFAKDSIKSKSDLINVSVIPLVSVIFLYVYIGIYNVEMLSNQKSALIYNAHVILFIVMLIVIYGYILQDIIRKYIKRHDEISLEEYKIIHSAMNDGLLSEKDVKSTSFTSISNWQFLILRQRIKYNEKNKKAAEIEQKKQEKKNLKSKIFS